MKIFYFRSSLELCDGSDAFSNLSNINDPFIMLTSVLAPDQLDIRLVDIRHIITVFVYNVVKIYLYIKKTSSFPSISESP